MAWSNKFSIGICVDLTTSVLWSEMTRNNSVQITQTGELIQVSCDQGNCRWAKLELFQCIFNIEYLMRWLSDSPGLKGSVWFRMRRAQLLYRDLEYDQSNFMARSVLLVYCHNRKILVRSLRDYFCFDTLGLWRIGFTSQIPIAWSQFRTFERMSTCDLDFCSMTSFAAIFDCFWSTHCWAVATDCSPCFWTVTAERSTAFEDSFDFWVVVGADCETTVTWSGRGGCLEQTSDCYEDQRQRQFG